MRGRQPGRRFSRGPSPRPGSPPSAEAGRTGQSSPWLRPGPRRLRRPLWKTTRESRAPWTPVYVPLPRTRGAVPRKGVGGKAQVAAPDGVREGGAASGNGRRGCLGKLVNSGVKSPLPQSGTKTPSPPLPDQFLQKPEAPRGKAQESHGRDSEPFHTLPGFFAACQQVPPQGRVSGRCPPGLFLQEGRVVPVDPAEDPRLVIQHGAAVPGRAPGTPQRRPACREERPPARYQRTACPARSRNPSENVPEAGNRDRSRRDLTMVRRGPVVRWVYLGSPPAPASRRAR